ncbi:hypothetical protein Y1Q_0003401 [Alligator mississippiensis]|uniref:Uncharacterized protein n=1 Tax=Alligator mississippiensis TaxID=8496 RepID=A0A151M3V8_ALLMI|nr:hypothetical protein Y1Q_0003401 [Alligator mississippiensis]
MPTPSQRDQLGLSRPPTKLKATTLAAMVWARQDWQEGLDWLSPWSRKHCRKLPAPERVEQPRQDLKGIGARSTQQLGLLQDTVLRHPTAL